ncbi:ATP-binding protein, partial [Streptomyces sp. NPDC046942]|uniref:ATP-binding protein n=1 Tax=Streptomyces sp. NPDC046942 TaxID=3155137 RepID=UPI0033FE59FB
SSHSMTVPLPVTERHRRTVAHPGFTEILPGPLQLVRRQQGRQPRGWPGAVSPTDPGPLDPRVALDLSVLWLLSLRGAPLLLVTHAIRYRAEPIRLRLIRERSLIREVSDGSSTSPHLRRARSFDAGARGLFMIAQLARRWGTRYSMTGKTIWAERQLDELIP